MTQYGTIQVGRLTLVELPKSAAVDQFSDRDTYGRTLAIQGQESVPGFFNTTLPQLKAKIDDLVGNVNSFVPVSFTDKSDRNGYYTISLAQVNEVNWEGEMASATWSITLNRIGADSEIDLQSRLTGAQTRNTSGAASGSTGVRTHTPPIGAYGYWSGPTIPSQINRPSADGTVITYSGLAITSTVRWGCAVGNYPGGRVRFLDDNGVERSGTQFPAPAPSAAWSFSNALVNVAPLTSGGVLNVSAYTSGAYQAKSWDLQVNGSTLGVPLSIKMLHNEYEMGVLRMTWNSTNVGRVTADLTLRRGSRLLELYLQTESSTTIKVVRSSAEIGTSTLTYVSASSNDAAGNRYIVGSAHADTADVANGGVSVSASVAMDAFIGVVAGGSGAIVGDRASDLFGQYLGFPAEQVTGVIR
jgi:hypothetical protein